MVCHIFHKLLFEIIFYSIKGNVQICNIKFIVPLLVIRKMPPNKNSISLRVFSRAGTEALTENHIEITAFSFTLKLAFFCYNCS